MQRLLMISAAALILAQVAPAATRTDSILAFTGNRHVKATWVRDAWTDANYNPIASHKDHKHVQIMVYSSMETGGFRALTDESDCVYPNITRKDGSQVVWSDRTNKCAWIRDFNGSAPKRNLNVGADYEVMCVNYNAATGEENLYVRSASMTSVYRIPFKSDYSLDLAKKTAIITGSVQVDEAFSMSGDGKMAGCALPWPDTKIINVETKTVYSRHVGQFGCNSNIAPDNSYRFFHFGDGHDLVHLFGPNLAETYTDIKTTGIPLGNGTITQQYPRFTSNVNFMSVVSPNHADDPDAWTFENDAIFSWNAAKVQQCPIFMFEALYLGKFAADFRSVTWTLIAGGDRRYIEGYAGGMVWVALDATDAAGNSLLPRGSLIKPQVIARGAFVEAVFPAGMTGSISLVNTSGRVIARASGIGGAVCPIGSGVKGTHIARVAAGSEVYSTRIVLR